MPQQFTRHSAANGFHLRNDKASKTQNGVPSGLSSLKEALEKVRTKNRVQALMFPQTAREELVHCGLSDLQADQFCVLCDVAGFYRLLDERQKPGQLEVERFVRLAVEHTGFRREVVMGLVSDITTALGTAVPLYGTYSVQSLLAETELALDPRNHTTLPAYTVPPSCYLREMEAVRKTFSSQTGRRGLVPRGDLHLLQLLCTVGFPEAQYYLGCFCMEKASRRKGVMAKALRERGVRLLEKAASAGNPEAAAVLGDFYYEQGRKSGGSDAWQQAIQYYTGYGIPTLDDASRRKRLLEILNRPSVNQRRVLFSTVLAIVCFCPAPLLSCLKLEPLVIHTISLQFGPCAPVMFSLSLFASLAACLATWFRIGKKPYGSCTKLPFCIAVQWAASWATFILVNAI